MFELAPEGTNWKHYEVHFDLIGKMKNVCVWWNLKLCQGGDLLIYATTTIPHPLE